MIHQRFGRIVNISSIWGLNGASYESIYAASKGGLIALTKSLAREVGPSGITVNALAPGPIKTNMMDAELNAVEQQDLAADIPAGRFGYPHEVASACRYLLTDDTAFINGHVLVLDGGWKV
jgi:3-oxoacyl-[acyl-carrier protein] reductase